MANMLKVEDSVLATLSADLKGCAEEMDSSVSEYGQSMGSVRGRWTGAASDSASGKHQRWESDMNQQISYLEELARTIDKIDEIYKQADQDAASFWLF